MSEQETPNTDNHILVIMERLQINAQEVQRLIERAAQDFSIGPRDLARAIEGFEGVRIIYKSSGPNGLLPVVKYWLRKENSDGLQD